LRIAPIAAVSAGVVALACAQQETLGRSGPQGETRPAVLTAAVKQPAPPPNPLLVRVGDSTTGNYLAGRLAQKNRDYGNASKFLNHALISDPRNSDLLRRAFLANLAKGEFEQAGELAQRIIATNKNAAMANLVLLVNEISQGHFERANERLLDMPRTGLNTFVVPLMRAWSLAGLDKPVEAVDALSPLGSIQGFAVLHNLHAGLIQDLGGNLEKAEERYRRATGGGSRATLRIVEALGSLLERRGKRNEAKVLYGKYLQENPDSLMLAPALARLESGAPAPRLVKSATEGAAEVLFNLAGTLTRENSAETALIYGRLALQMRPDYPIAQMLVGRILESLGRPEDAIEVYDSVARSSALSWSARLRKAASLESLGQEDEAIEQLRAMVDSDDARTDVLVNLGDILRSKKRFDESVEAYDKAIGQIGAMKKRHWMLLYSRGIALERSKQWSRAEKDFLAALELNPDQPYVLNYLGYSWVDQGIKLDRAKTMIERAVELRPNDGYIVDSLGWALYRIKDYPVAVRHLERAVELRPQDPTINDHLGDAYWRVGRRNEARFQWRRSLSLDPEPDQAEQIRIKIKNGLAEEPKSSERDS
jgi:tetratricopeptide (TPR) repeat protein